MGELPHQKPGRKRIVASRKNLDERFTISPGSFTPEGGRHGEATLAEFLEKDMLPEAHLCSPESEELRRVIKTRKTLVETIVSVKNQLHGLLLSMGIESKRGQLQSAKERRRVKSVLAAHHVVGDEVRGICRAGPMGAAP